MSNTNCGRSSDGSQGKRPHRRRKNEEVSRLEKQRFQDRLKLPDGWAKGRVKIWMEVNRSRRITPRDKKLYRYLARFPKGCRKSDKTLACELGWPERKIRESRLRLEQEGFIKPTPRGRQMTRIVRIVPLDGDFAMVPLTVLDDKNLSYTAQSLLTAVAHAQGNKDACWPTKAVHARNAGLSLKTVCRLWPQLLAMDYLDDHACIEIEVIRRNSDSGPLIETCIL